MVGFGIVIIIGAILISMGLAIYMYSQYQPNFIPTNIGETVIVGPVQYVISFEGTHEGDEKLKPENIFFKIRIDAKNMGDESTTISGGQFFLLNENDQKHQPVYGNFSKNDLLITIIDPNQSLSFTTQFDVPFDGTEKYTIAIRPSKQQSSVDTALVCVTNC